MSDIQSRSLASQKLQLPRQKITESITSLIQIHHKSYSNAPSSERKLYQNLLNWFIEQQLILNKLIKESKMDSFECIHKQFELFAMSMEKIAEVSSEYCEEKGQIIRMLKKQQTKNFNMLMETLDQRLKLNLKVQVQNQIKTEREHEQKLKQLENQIEELSANKNKKWKNMFMLIKDNRILRRQRGKMIRELKQRFIKESKLEEKLSQIIRENQRYKLLFSENYFKGEEFQTWSKEMLNLIKYEKTLKTYPKKAFKTLEYGLQALGIDEMKTVEQKIDYITKAIEEADEIAEYYEDMNDYTTPSKLLFNNSTQTQIEYEQKGVNTIQKQYANVYCQVKKSELASQKLELHSKIYQQICLEVSTKLSNSLRKSKTPKKQNSDPRYSMKSQHFDYISKKSKEKEFTYCASINMALCYQYKIVEQNHRQQSVVTMQQRLRQLTIEPKNNVQFTFYGVRKVKSKKEINSERSGDKKSVRESLQQSSFNFQKQNEQYVFRQQTPKNSFKQRLSHNYVSVSQKKRNSSNLTTRFSINTNQKSVRINQLQEINEERENSITDQKNQQQSSSNHEPPSSSNDRKTLQQPQQKNLIQSRFTNQNFDMLMKKTPISREKRSEMEKQSIAARSSKLSESVFNIFGDNTANSHQQQLEKQIGFEVISEQQHFGQQKLQTGQQKPEALSNQKLPPSNQTDPSINLAKVKKKHQKIIKVNTNRASVVNPVTSNFDQGVHHSEKIDKFQRNSYMLPKSSSSRISQLQNTNVLYQSQQKLHESSIKYRKSTQQCIKNKTESSISASKNRANKIINRIETAPNAPNYFTYFFDSQRQISSCHIDIFRVIQKIVHLLYVHRSELRFSQKTLKEFVESNLKSLFGCSPESQFFYFNKQICMWKEHNPLVCTFTKMLSFDYPQAYLNDLLKIYVILLDRCGNENLLVQRSKALKIIEHVLSMFYRKQTYDSIIEEISYLHKPIINLNDFFLTLESLIKRDTIESQLYCYLREILPQNQIDLNISQIQQLTRILDDNLELETHLTRLKFYCQRDIKNTKNNLNIGMKINKVSLYAVLFNWRSFREIVGTIKDEWERINTENFEGIFKSLKEIKTIQSLKEMRRTKQFKQQIQRQVLYQIQNKLLIKKQCPWLYSLAKIHIKNHSMYNSKLSHNFLLHLQLTEYKLQINAINIFPEKLNMISTACKQLIRRLGLQKIFSQDE